MSYQATIKAGAQAYSPDGARAWGVVPVHIIAAPVTVDGEVGNKVVVDQPRWNNDKRWSVEKIYVTKTSGGDEPPVEPPDQPVVDANDVMKHYVGGILVEEFQRVVK